MARLGQHHTAPRQLCADHGVTGALTGRGGACSHARIGAGPLVSARASTSAGVRWTACVVKGDPSTPPPTWRLSALLLGAVQWNIILLPACRMLLCRTALWPARQCNSRAAVLRSESTDYMPGCYDRQSSKSRASNYLILINCAIAGCRMARPNKAARRNKKIRAYFIQSIEGLSNICLQKNFQRPGTYRFGGGNTPSNAAKSRRSGSVDLWYLDAGSPSRSDSRSHISTMLSPLRCS
jgi:hypothetical protein